jgi:hypothetical protein
MYILRLKSQKIAGYYTSPDMQPEGCTAQLCFHHLFSPIFTPCTGAIYMRKKYSSDAFTVYRPKIREGHCRLGTVFADKMLR